jgi:hypothetical protein
MGREQAGGTRHPEGKPAHAHILRLHRQHGERQEGGR